MKHDAGPGEYVNVFPDGSALATTEQGWDVVVRDGDAWVSEGDFDGWRFVITD